jgi:hypothetical protein
MHDTMSADSSRNILNFSVHYSITRIVPLVHLERGYVLLAASASARRRVFLVPPSNATKGQIPLSLRAELLLPLLGDWKILPRFAFVLITAQSSRSSSSFRLRQPTLSRLGPIGERKWDVAEAATRLEGRSPRSIVDRSQPLG